jgi:anti-sigma factor RsiW
VTDYFEGALSPEDRGRFEEHISTCDGCRVYVEQMRRTIELVGRLSVDTLTPEAERDLLQAFRGWRSA